MKKLIVLYLIVFSWLTTGCAQTKPTPNEHPHCINAEFDKKVSDMISFSIPTIDVQKLKDIQNEVYIFDTRKQTEYDVSHIKNARYLGYQDFDPKILKDIPKNSPIVLYCSIGYRSEKIGEKLSSLGYTNVYNLYGSIFEWVNQGNAVVDKNGNLTTKVHTYNQQWSKWLDGKKVEKVW